MLLLIGCSCCVPSFRSAALKHEQASPLELPGSWAVGVLLLVLSGQNLEKDRKGVFKNFTY